MNDKAISKSTTGLARVFPMLASALISAVFVVSAIVKKNVYYCIRIQIILHPERDEFPNSFESSL